MTNSPQSVTVFFPVVVSGVARLSPSFVRVSFSADTDPRALAGGYRLAEYGDPGFDQRIKIFFPQEGVADPRESLATIPTGEGWFAAWRHLDPDHRPTMRTYTTRAVHRDATTGEVVVDVDMVYHDPLGPAARWVRDVAVGDPVVLLGPNTDHPGPLTGMDFVPPAQTDRYLIAGDETAVPAIARILEDLSPHARGTVVVQVPHPEDARCVTCHPGFQVHLVTVAEEQPAGSSLSDKTVAVARELVEQTGDRTAVELTTSDIVDDADELTGDEPVVWVVPRTARGGAALKYTPLYVWLAGEAGTITTIRRQLVTELGIDRRSVAFMGYWRRGRAES